MTARFCRAPNDSNHHIYGEVHPSCCVGLTANGSYFDSQRTPFVLTMYGSLHVLPVAGLTFEDILPLDPIFSDFAGTGAEASKNVAGSVSDAASARCSVWASYHAQWKVARADVAHYAVDSVDLTASSSCCTLITPSGSAACGEIASSRSVVTGLGNPVKVGIDTTIDTSAKALRRPVSISYSDVAKYFGGAATVHAVVVVHVRGTNADRTEQHDVDLTLQSGCIPASSRQARIRSTLSTSRSPTAPGRSGTRISRRATR